MDYLNNPYYCRVLSVEGMKLGGLTTDKFFLSSFLNIHCVYVLIKELDTCLNGKRSNADTNKKAC